MDIQKGFLRQYLYVVAINQGLMDREIAASLEGYDRETFLRVLQSRIEHLELERKSETAFFSQDYYISGIESAREAIENLDVILAGPG